MQAATFAPGRDWRGAVLNPPFDPMHLYYQAFFEAAPEKAGDLFVRPPPADRRKCSTSRFSTLTSASEARSG